VRGIQESEGELGVRDGGIRSQGCGDSESEKGNIGVRERGLGVREGRGDTELRKGEEIEGSVKEDVGLLRN
jgi:hypothetical protein